MSRLCELIESLASVSSHRLDASLHAHRWYLTFRVLMVSSAIPRLRSLMLRVAPQS